MMQRIFRVLALVGGALLVLAGIAGLFLPFVQGIFLLILGFYILMRFSPEFREYTKRFRGKHPKIDSLLDTLEERLDRPPKERKGKKGE
jgi:uncharacterized membrane protein YbaN (DUF454 family)